MKALVILNDEKGLNVSPRRVTVSTVGIVPGIERLARENPRVRLALSLNATTNEVREKLMPVTRKYPIEALIPALEQYARASDHRITLEYVLIKGVNDTPADADRLGGAGLVLHAGVPGDVAGALPARAPGSAGRTRRRWDR